MDRQAWLSQFVVWVWPPMFTVVAGLFHGDWALGGWTAVGVGFLFMQAFQWASRQPGSWTFKFLTGVAALGVLSAVLFGWGVRPGMTLVAQAVGLVGMGVVFRWFQVPAVFPGTGRWWALFLTAGEGLYCTGWMVLAWLYRYMPRHGPGLTWSQWLASPLPFAVLVMGLQCMGLQALDRVNPAHPEGRAWLQAVRLAVTVGMFAVPVVGVHLFRLPPVWYSVGLLWLYTYRTHRRFWAWLRQGEADAVSPLASVEIRYRVLREVLYYGLLLLGLVGNSFLG